MKNIKNIEKLKPTLKEMETIDTKFISYILAELITAIYTTYIKKSKMKSSLLQLLMITSKWKYNLTLIKILIVYVTMNYYAFIYVNLK